MPYTCALRIRTRANSYPMPQAVRPISASAAALQVGLCALWGLGQIATKVANGGISPVFHAGIRSLGATVLLAAWILWRRSRVWQRDGTLGAGIWAILAYQIVVIASVSYLAWFWLVSRHRATTLHAFTFLTPLFGVAFAHLLLGEPITPALLAALALIAAGIVLVNRG